MSDTDKAWEEAKARAALGKSVHAKNEAAHHAQHEDLPITASIGTDATPVHSRERQAWATPTWTAPEWTPPAWATPTAAPAPSDAPPSQISAAGNERSSTYGDTSPSWGNQSPSHTAGTSAPNVTPELRAARGMFIASLVNHPSIQRMHAVLEARARDPHLTPSTTWSSHTTTSSWSSQATSQTASYGTRRSSIPASTAGNWTPTASQASGSIIAAPLQSPHHPDIQGSIFSLTEGRINRHAYVIGGLVIPTMLFVMPLIFAALSSVGSDDNSLTLTIAGFLILIGTPLSLYLFIRASIRRLHDIGLSGWWLLALGLIGPIVPILLWLLPSQQAHNRYGNYVPSGPAA